MKKTYKEPSLEKSITQKISGEVSYTYKHLFAVLSHVLSFWAILLHFSHMTLIPGDGLKIQVQNISPSWAPTARVESCLYSNHPH